MHFARLRKACSNKNNCTLLTDSCMFHCRAELFYRPDTDSYFYLFIRVTILYLLSPLNLSFYVWIQTSYDHGLK